MEAKHELSQPCKVEAAFEYILLKHKRGTLSSEGTPLQNIQAHAASLSPEPHSDLYALKPQHPLSASGWQKSIRGSMLPPCWAPILWWSFWVSLRWVFPKASTLNHKPLGVWDCRLRSCCKGFSLSYHNKGTILFTIDPHYGILN